MRLTIATRAALVASLPFPSTYPQIAVMDARRRYASARASELDTIRASRRTLAASSGAGPYARGMASEALPAARQFLANLRAARVAFRVA